MKTPMLNICGISSTFPEMPNEMISRDSLLEMIESYLEKNKVLVINGDRGVGLTTILAMFAGRHSQNGISYFCSDFTSLVSNTAIIKANIVEQLDYYVDGINNQIKREKVVISSLYRIMRKLKQKNQVLYFIFDGFDRFTDGSKESIRNFLKNIYNIQNARFLFSGQIDKVKELLPNTETLMSYQILRFEKDAVLDYVKKIIPNMSEAEAEIFWSLSKGNAERLSCILDIYTRKKSMDIINELDRRCDENLYISDYKYIENCSLEKGKFFLALITLSEIPIHKNIITSVLDINKEEYQSIIDYFTNYVISAEDYPQINNRSLRKYLYRTMDSGVREETENLLITILETEKPEETFYSLPSLYRSTDRQHELVKYLTSEKVQEFLEKRRSQSAINEQCDYGRDASSATNQADVYFRFAVTRSASREIEQNELAETELLALLAVGDVETAYNLSQNVFLLEERLKCLLLIAQRKDILPTDMVEDVLEQITELVNSINFAYIPDKAIDLAQLLLPINFYQALSIIDQIAKVTSDRQRIDKLYTMFSLAYNEEGDGNLGDVAKADIVATRITDEKLRTLSQTMKGIFCELTVAQLLVEIEKLPTDSNKLYFLQFWIPEHKNIDNVGDVILYAVKLIIQASDISTPKVSLLKEYCKPLSSVSKDIIEEIIIKLDAITEYIKYPTIDYVELQLLVIEALSKYDKQRAYSKLEDLYLEISEYQDIDIMIHAKSLLLANYDKLGTPKEMQDVLMPSFQLQKEIEENILKQFEHSAYHMKVIEGVIKALICTYPSLIDTVVPSMNTEARRSRAYLLAASVYAEKEHIDTFDANRFLKYVNAVKYDLSDIGTPLKTIIRRLTIWKKDDKKIFSIMKKLSSVFDIIENISIKCYVLSKVYIWGAKHYPTDTFFQYIKNNLDNTWENIDSPWLKVIIGYEIAKSLSVLSLKQESHEYIKKTNQYRNEQILPNFSCVRAVHASLSMYVHSLGILIRSGLSTEDDMGRFRNILSHYESNGETIVLWGNLALEYYVSGNKEKFSNIVRLYIDKDLSKFSLYDQKKILFNISPALYLNAPEQYMQKLSVYDESFKCSCIEHIASFVISQYPYISEVNTKNNQNVNRELEYNDVNILIHLMKISPDECFVFNYVDLLTKKEREQDLRRLSREQRKDMLSSLEEIVKTKFPTQSGIQHQGYQIICEAMLVSCKQQYRSADWESIKNKIETIDNIADKAFLYLQSANYIRNTEKRNLFLDNGLRYSMSISGGFDKLNRMDLCLSTTFLSRDKIRTKKVTNTIMDAMLKNENGTYQDYQKIIDIIYENDPQLADQMVEQVDRDIVRLNFKNRLKRHMLSNKKIGIAKDSLQNVISLNEEEQSRFYERQLADLIAHRATVRDVNELNPILASIYQGPIMNLVDAIVYYMENLYQKNMSLNTIDDMLRQIHEALYCNLRLVFAISSSTQDKMKRINDVMNRKKETGYDGMVLAGQDTKGYKYIKEWYTKYHYDVLRIIDPYFHPEDLIIIKQLFDINNSLDVTILTNLKNKDASMEDFQMGWNQISSDMTGKMKIIIVRYADNLDKSPIHDRWWILFDPEDGNKEGIQLPSVGTLGVRDALISPIEKSILPTVDERWRRYVDDKIRRTEAGERIVYEEILIK